MIRLERLLAFNLHRDVQAYSTRHSRLVSALLCISKHFVDASQQRNAPKLYHTSISPESVRTSMIVCPRKSSLSRVNFCRSFDLRSLSSSHTRILMRSVELWHSLKRVHHEFICTFLNLNSQEEFLVPLRIQLLMYGSRTLSRLAHLHRNVGIAFACLVLGD